MRILHGLIVFLGGIAIATGTALALSSCSTLGKAVRPADPPAVVITTPAANSGYGDPSITTRDVELEIKIRSKQCFGSAGCTIEYDVEPRTDLMELKRSGADWEVTYQVTGDESGPITGTLTFRPDGTFTKEVFLQASTRKSSDRLTIKVLEVERV